MSKSSDRIYTCTAQLPNNFLADNSMIYKHKKKSKKKKKKDAHSLAAKVILVKLGPKACW